MQTNEEPARERTYSVPQISCGHCKDAIERVVGCVPGVAIVIVDVVAKSVRVQGDAAESSVRGAIQQAGYDVVDLAD